MVELGTYDWFSSFYRIEVIKLGTTTNGILCNMTLTSLIKSVVPLPTLTQPRLGDPWNPNLFRTAGCVAEIGSLPVLQSRSRHENEFRIEVNS